VKRIAVDVDETNGGAMVSCVVARATMTTYLARAGATHWPKGDTGRTLDVIRAGEKFTCYTSRPDRVGWDYHCNLDRSSLKTIRFVDIGAGRRGRLCTLKPFDRRCGPG
jgi:hypothetical protein